ncbi:MAG TPA: lysyl oxidase family protein [Candidatus Binatia bacterium]|nr:lysyl oxidase family protein [Candidatus Binatia bacterium]
MLMMRVLAAAAVMFSIAAATPGPALALPDLIAEIYDLSVNRRDVDPDDAAEGCAGGVDDRRLIDFSLRTRNIGQDDLFLGNPNCPNCSTSPGAVCGNPLFVCGTAHGHAHFESFARTQLLDSNDNVVAEGRKYGFCLLDLECDDPQYSCSFQGISAGCADVYSAGLPCQYVDITDAVLPDGDYTLRVTIDPDGEIAESDETNNTVEVPLTIGTTAPICPEYASTDVPKTLPDLASAVSNLTLPDLGEVTGMRVRMAGEHSYLGDVVAQLASPSGTEVTLLDNVCGGSEDFDLYLGDETASSITCPATDPSQLRQPSEPLAPLFGESTAGVWSLRFQDTAGSDSGTLQSWSLEVCTVCGNGTIDPGEVCDDGNLASGDCCASDCMSNGADGTPCVNQNKCMAGATCSAGTCQGGDLVQCDPCLVCDAELGCIPPTAIFPCQHPEPGRSVVTIKDGLTGAGDSVTWKWKSQTPVELDEFGAPHVSTELTLCVYDSDGVVVSATAQSGSDCGDGACWDVRDTSAAFRAGDGLTSIRIKEGLQGKIVLKGSGDPLGVDPLFLSLPATVRLQRNDGTPCWEADFATPSVNSGNVFKSRSE